MLTVTYPGTFDPITLGHLDLIRRGASLFPKLIVAVAESKEKHALFSLDERVEMVRASCRGLKNVEIFGFDGLLVEFLRAHQSRTILRGTRAVGDFEYEFQLAEVNRLLMPEAETLFLIPQGAYRCISSTFVREVAKMGGDLSQLAPEAAIARLKEKYPLS